MPITSDLFEAYLKCATKCFLRSLGETGTGNSYANWVKAEQLSYSSEGIKYLVEGVAGDECVTGAIDSKELRSPKATLIWLAARYAFVEKSILVVTEGLGQQRFHGRVVLMVNEHTASAGEMVSAFAEENNLATIVGTKTPGRLLSGSAYKVGHGYILGLSVAAYLTWQGRMLENNGIAPKFSVELSREALKQGRDTQLGTAIDVAKAL